MCVSEIKNVRKINLFTQEEKETFVLNVITGIINVDNLDVNQYLRVARKLSDSIELGFGFKEHELEKNSEHALLLADLIKSAYEFASAKQYQLVRDILHLLKEKEYDSKNEIINVAISAFDKYNERYLSAEIENFELQAKAAYEWLDFVKWNQV